MHIEQIKSPADLRALDNDQLLELSVEIREFLVEAVSRTGGHLGSNLGAVELSPCHPFIILELLFGMSSVRR